MVESGLERICKALTRNSTITELDLRNNGISPTGGTALGEMLSVNTSLKRIDLRWNNLGSSGGKAILEGLLRNRSMIDVMLAGNKVSDETLRQVDQCLHKVSGLWILFWFYSALVSLTSARARVALKTESNDTSNEACVTEPRPGSREHR